MEKLLTIGVIALFIGIAIVPPISSQNVKNQNTTGMRINFYEEFPTYENLSKAELINFPSTIFIAAKSLKEFRELEKDLYDINPMLEAAYWPILNKSYWVSPSSLTYELENLLKDLEKNKENETLKVLIDLESPSREFYFRNFKNISLIQGKNLIKKIFEKAEEFNIKIYAHEGAYANIIEQMIRQIKGLSYPLRKYSHTKIFGYFSELYKPYYRREPTIRYMERQHNKYGEIIQAALGLIAVGQAGNELLVSPEELDVDLCTMYEIGLRNVTIFRLGGLNEDYLNVINKYV